MHIVWAKENLLDDVFSLKALSSNTFLGILVGLSL